MEAKNKEQFKKEHMLRLQGKEYLPVAPRVVMFRADHGFEISIATEAVEIAGMPHIKASVFKILDGTSRTIATAHKRIKSVEEARGASREWPVETAETGAIGRALALCGYGTLSGDLDEGDELADAPIDKSNNRPMASETQTSEVRF